MIKHSLMAFALGLALNAQGGWAESHSDTQSRLVIAWRGLLQRYEEICTRKERYAEEQRFRTQSRAYYAWREESYFPENALAPDDGYGDHSKARRFSYFLSGMKEPILYNRQMDKDEAIIRLTILPAFGGQLVFRAHSNGSDNALTFKISHASGWGPVENVETRVISLDHPAFTRILNRAFETRACEDAHDNRFGFDGAKWAVEVKTAGSYCTDSVWTPAAGPWQDLAQEVLLHVEGDSEVLIAKWTIGMPLSEEEERQINQLFK